MCHHEGPVGPARRAGVPELGPRHQGLPRGIAPPTPMLTVVGALVPILLVVCTCPSAWGASHPPGRRTRARASQPPRTEGPTPRAPSNPTICHRSTSCASGFGRQDHASRTRQGAQLSSGGRDRWCDRIDAGQRSSRSDGPGHRSLSHPAAELPLEPSWARRITTSLTQDPNQTAAPPVRV
jgi:hypothetical protein